MLAAYPLQMLKDKSEGRGPSPALNFKYDSYNTRNYGKEKPLVVPSFRGNYCKNLMYVCVILLEFLSLLIQCSPSPQLPAFSHSGLFLSACAYVCGFVLFIIDTFPDPQIAI